MKKFLSLLLSLSLIFSMSVLCAGAETNALPESEHNYKNNVTDTKTYTYPGNPEGIYVKFSEDTYTEAGDAISVLTNDSLTPEDIEKVGETGCLNKKGDTISIEYGDNIPYGNFQGGDLAGQTIYFPSDTFTVTLTSDGSVSGYGYKVEEITLALPATTAKAIYHLDGKQYISTYSVSSDFYLPYNLKNMIVGNQAVIGWQTEDGQQLYYDNMGSNKAAFDYGEKPESGTPEFDEYMSAYRKWLFGSDFVLEGGQTYDFYPMFCNVSILPEEVYSFTNSERYFCKNVDGYYYTNEHFYHQFIDYGATFALSPLAPVGFIVCAFDTVYWPTFEWSGSCCGFPITILLQHYGKIDMLSEQNVKTVSELEPTDNVISRINFYNNQAVAAFPTDNMGIKPGTKDYTRQLKKLFKTVESGTPVYFECYYDSEHPLLIIQNLDLDMIAGAHGVLLTGGYTDQNGNHIILGHNNNSSKYMNGYADIYTIDKDFTCIYDNYGDYLNGFSWNSEILHFESFPAIGVPNPFSWHISFFRNLITNLIEILRSYLGIEK